MTTPDAAAPALDRPGPGQPAYEEDLPPLGRLRIVPLSPQDDVDLICAWVAEERARFWGMQALQREEVLGIYEFLDSLETHQAYLIRLEGQPAGLFQTYEPLHDPVGEAYPALPGDIGMHLLLAPATRPVPDFTPVLVSALIRFMFLDPAKDRIIVEPDARNGKAIRRLETTCFQLGPIIRLEEKDAQLAFLPRARFEIAGRAATARA